MIGSQTYGAEKKELQKARGGIKVEFFPPEKEIKRIRDRDKDIEIDNKENEENKGKKRHAFMPPTYEEVVEYAKERGREDLAKEFYDYFTVGDWIDSKGVKVRRWKQKFITWCARNEKKEEPPQKSQVPKHASFNVDDAFKLAMERSFDE